MPPASQTRVLTALRDELERAGVARRPNAAGSLPPVFVEPADGPPAPGEREGTEAGTDLVVTLRLSTSTSPMPGHRIDVIDVVVRSKGTVGLKAGRELFAAIVERIVDGASYGRGVLIGYPEGSPVFVLEASLFAGIGPVSDSAGVRTEIGKLALEVG